MADRIIPAATQGAGLRGEFRPSYRPARPPASARLAQWPRADLIAALCAAMVVSGVTVVTLFGRHPAGVPVIEAPAGPVRVKPADSGGMKLNNTDLLTVPGTSQALAPPAEQPEIRQLRKQLQAVKKQVERQAVQTAEIHKLAAAAGRIMASPAPAKASDTVREPAPPALPPPEAGVRVQLAAFTDAAAASTEWDTLVAKYPDWLGSRRPEISRVEAAGHTMWRLRTGPFAGVTQARDFCARLRDHGTDCSIAAF